MFNQLKIWLLTIRDETIIDQLKVALKLASSKSDGQSCLLRLKDYQDKSIALLKQRKLPVACSIKQWEALTVYARSQRSWYVSLIMSLSKDRPLPFSKKKFPLLFSIVMLQFCFRQWSKYYHAESEGIASFIPIFPDLARIALSILAFMLVISGVIDQLRLYLKHESMPAIKADPDECEQIFLSGLQCFQQDNPLPLQSSDHEENKYIPAEKFNGSVKDCASSKDASETNHPHQEAALNERDIDIRDNAYIGIKKSTDDNASAYVHLNRKNLSALHPNKKTGNFKKDLTDFHALLKNHRMLKVVTDNEKRTTDSPCFRMDAKLKSNGLLFVFTLRPPTEVEKALGVHQEVYSPRKITPSKY